MSLENCILLRMATARDTAMTGEVLARANLESRPCPDMAHLLADLDATPGTLVIAEEMLAAPALTSVAEVLDRQSPWSDMPVVVLARQGANSPTLSKVMERLPNVTVLECPVRMASLITVVRSVLRARARQYELRTLLSGLQVADQRKTEFLATLAHELRNPLAPITAALAILGIQNTDPALARHHDMISRQVRYMGHLVNDLMEVSRITRGTIGLQRTRVDVNDLIDEAVEMSRPLIEASSHELRVEKSPLPLHVDGDATRLMQVFANLLNNAAKYTLPGGSIAIRSTRRQLEAVVEVIDNGAGLDASMLEAIFEMFVQVNGTARTAQGGLGIGLTLVKSLVDLHGGAVTAASEGLSRGSTFEVRLPLAPSPAGNGSALPGSSLLRIEPTLRLQRVLVADDNRDAADSLGELLNAVGAQASTAYRGEEVLELTARQEFDAVVLDIGMPGMDGCEVARRLRARTGHRQPTLIALTGWGQDKERLRVAEAGFDHHLLKPVDLSKLMNILSNDDPGIDSAREAPAPGLSPIGNR